MVLGNLNLVNVYAVPTTGKFSNELILKLSSGRVLYQHHIPSRLRHLSRANLTASLHELTDCHLHGPQSSINICAASSVSSRLLPLSPSTVRVDGVELPTDSDLSVSLTTHEVDSHRVTIASNTHGVPIIIWLNGQTLYPLSSKTTPGVFIQSRRKRPLAIDNISSREISLDEDAIPIPEENQTHYGNNSEPAALSVTESCQKGSPPRQVELAVAFDAEYCNVFSVDGAEAAQSLRALVAEAEKAFSDDTCIRLKVNSFDGVCNAGNDPYSNIGSDPLEMFRQYWISNMDSVKRDVAYFVSGAEDGTSTAGRAYLRATCNNAYGYGWAEGNSPAILAHEMGHTLGADHAESGLMKPSLSGNDPLKFSAASLQEIISFVDDGGASSDCLTSISGGGQSNPPSRPSASPSTSSIVFESPSQSTMPLPSSSPSPSASSSSEPSPTSSPQESSQPSKSTLPAPASTGPKMPRSPKASKSPKPSTSPSPSDVRDKKMTPEPARSPLPEKTPKQSEPAPKSSTPKPVASFSDSPETSMVPSMPTESPEPSTYVQFTPMVSGEAMVKRDTCERSLRRMGRTLPCTYWDELGSLGTRLGSIVLRLRQINNRFRLYAKPEEDPRMGGEIKIISLVARFSFLTDASEPDDYLERSVGKNRTYAQVNAHPKLLELPDGSYCCGAMLYIDVSIDVSRKIMFGTWHYEGTSDARGVYAFRVRCSADCRKRAEHSFGEDCPVCA